MKNCRLLPTNGLKVRNRQIFLESYLQCSSQRLQDRGKCLHKSLKLFGIQALGSVRKGDFRIVMDLDQDAVCTRGGRGQSHWRYEVTHARAVVRIHKHRQMSQLLKLAYRREIKGVACSGLKSPDAPFAENDVPIAFADDILCGHQYILNGCGHTPLEDNGLLSLTQRSEQPEVLHVSSADLEGVRICGHGLHIRDFNYFRDTGQAGCSGDFSQDLQSLQSQALKGIGAGAWLEGAAAENMGTGLLDALRRLGEYRERFHGAGTRHNAEPGASYSVSADSNLGGLRMHFPANGFVWRQDGVDPLDSGVVFKMKAAQSAFVAQGSNNRSFGSREMKGLQVQRGDVVEDFLCISGSGRWLEDDDHERF